MKICVPLRDKPSINLREGNLRSESRWERLALEAVLTNPEVTEVYTYGYEWPGGREKNPKYRGLLKRGGSYSNCILLTQDWNLSVINSHPFKAIFINIFHGPWLEQREEIAKVTAKLNDQLFFVLGHPILFSGEDSIDPTKVYRPHQHLYNFVTPDRLLYLPLPWVPRSCFQEQFQKKNLLYLWRIIFLSTQICSAKPVQWALEELRRDPSLRLRILTGWECNEAKDYVDGEVYWIKEDINDYFWGLKDLQPYKSIRNQVELCYSLGWCDVLNEYTNAKLLIPHTHHWGGPSIEAAMHGVPFVGLGTKAGSLATCPGYLHTGDDVEAVNILGRLMTDEPFYRETAKAYHDFAVQTYSFDTFNKTLNNILSSRGLLT